tara:strand:+ start:30 stop:710 length:681 start_codon:yes stop_codon:yes gene_type:complete
LAKVLEKADIESVNFGGYQSPTTEVRGYQNYNISDNNILALNNPTKLRPWTDNKVKAFDFDKFWDKVNPNSYADFGSNLGFYVFHSVQKYNVDAVGVDYNSEYTNLCNTIASRHSIDKAQFKNLDLQTWCKQADYYDFMTVFNVIHHLYNRTEQYMDMHKLVSDFASKASTVLFEFPTERDTKGYKWTMDTNYSEQLFVDSAKQLFFSVERFDGQTEERPYYLCSN